MAPRKRRTNELLDSIRGQLLELSVAAGLARMEVVPQPQRVYDTQHLSDLTDVVADTLIRVAPVYVSDSIDTAPRQLEPAELEGAHASRGGASLALRDGRTFARVCIRRADLRQAMVVLKAAGIPHRALQAAVAAPPPQPEGILARLRAQFMELEKLLQPPIIELHAARARALIVSIARSAPQGDIANRAMQVISALYQAPPDGGDAGRGIVLALARLRAALGEFEHEKP